MRALVVVPGGQVEVLQASPLVRTLAAAGPETAVIVACSPAAAEVAGALEGAEGVVALRGLGPGAPPFAWLQAWARLRRMRSDAALVCSTAVRARLLAYLAGVPRRLGPAGGASAVLLSDRVRWTRGENRAAVWLRLAGLLGAGAERHRPSLDPGAAADRAARVQIHGSGIADGRLLIALAPGCAHSDLPGTAREATAWAPDRWAHLANQLALRHGAGILFVGAAGDEGAVTAASVDVDAPHADVAGQLDTLATASLLGHCDLVVSGDSPLLHLAAAMGTPTVGLFGPTDGRRRGPYGEEHRVVQALPTRRGGPRSAGLMARIRVEDVLAGIESPL